MEENTFEFKEERTYASIFNLVPSGILAEEREDAVETMENNINSKPYATELFKSSLFTSEYSINAQNNVDDVSRELQFHIEQENVTITHGPSYGIGIKSKEKRQDTCVITKEESELHNGPSSPQMVDGIRKSSNPGCVHSEEISMNQPAHPPVMKKSSDLSESDASQWQRFKVHTVKTKHTFEQRHSHIDPFISLCKIPNTIVKLNGHLRLPITSDTVLSPLCWFGVRETCLFPRQSNDFNCSESISIPTIKMQPIKDACRFLKEENTYPTYGMSVVDQLIFGYPELENDVADTNTSISPCHLNSLMTCSTSSAIESNELNKEQSTTQICTGMEMNDLHLDYNEMACIKRHIQILNSEGPFECAEFGKYLITQSNMTMHMKIDTCKKSFKCPDCDKYFSTKSNMSRHLRKRIGEKPFKCTECGKCFRQLSGLNVHMRSHTGEKPFKCLECGKCFSQKSHINIHMRSHTGEKPFKCPECGKYFSRKSYMNIHKRSHTGEKPFKCSECDKCFSRKSCVSIHKRSHTGEKPFKCSECDKCFSRKSRVNIHMRSHTGEKLFKCPDCGKCFSQKSNMNRHMRSLTCEKRFNCLECGNYFSRKSCMDFHKRSHTGENPFKCPKCGKCFSQQSCVNTHMKSQTCEKLFKCPECGKCFSQKSHMSRHMRSHTGDKLFRCRKCGKSFSEKSDKNVHMKSHTGIKPFKCSECDKCFSEKSYYECSYEITHR